MTPPVNDSVDRLRSFAARGRRIAGGVRRRARNLPDTVREQARQADIRKRPYTYDPERYRVHFGEVVVPNSWTFPVDHLEYATEDGADVTAEAPRVMYCFWTGENPLTPARSRSLDSLRAMNPTTPVVLVTPTNLKDFIVPGHPLHPAYDRLSTIHRSDYLRAYFMLHHGGIYTDIKPMTGPWAPLLDRLNASPTAWCAGPEELSAFNVSPAMGIMGDDQKKYYSTLPCQASFAFKPGTPFAEAWNDEIWRRMEYYSALLQDHPAQGVFGLNADYPVAWNAIQGSVFSPLCLRFHDRMLTDPHLTYDYSNGYR